MFNSDFYPTPPEVAAEMLDPLDLRGRVVLEPSAGSGNLVKECQPTPVTDPMVVSFRKWNGKRSLLNQCARWTGDGWDPKRWVPNPPVIPVVVLQSVERQMREVEA